jgi:hypothetical protein
MRELRDNCFDGSIVATLQQAQAEAHATVAGLTKMKRRKKKLNAATEARRRARKSGIAPATTRVIADKRKRQPKHKERLEERE